MTAVQEHLDNYFSSLNPLTKSIWKEKENLKSTYPGNWDDLDPDDQDKFWANSLITSSIRQKYAHIPKEDTPDVFPKLKINSGEKIVVDFDNDDGWTWRDEHSGPFSWMSRSQQDLTLDDLDNLEDQMKKHKSRGKSRSPDRDNQNRKPREPPFVNNHNKGKNANAEAASTADEIFQKFGIAFSFNNEEAEDKNRDVGDQADGVHETHTTLSPVEESNLLPGQEYQNYNFVLGEGDPAESESAPSSYQDDSLAESYNSNDISSLEKRRSSDGGKMKSSFNNQSHHLDLGSSLESGHFDVEASLIANEQTEPYDYDLSYNQEPKDGQISPIYIEPAGESDTDPRYSLMSMSSSRSSYPDTVIMANSPSVLSGDDNTSRGMGSRESSVICEQPMGGFDITNVTTADDIVKELDEWNQETFKTTEKTVTPDTSEDTSVKTGFDFLDNW